MYKNEFALSNRKADTGDIDNTIRNLFIYIFTRLNFRSFGAVMHQPIYLHTHIANIKNTQTIVDKKSKINENKVTLNLFLTLTLS